MATKTHPLRVRITEETRVKLDRWAELEGIKISDIARNALDAYLTDEQGHLRRAGTRSRKPISGPHNTGLRLDQLTS